MREGEALSTVDAQEQFCAMYAESLPVVYGFLLFRVAGNRELAEDLTAETFAAAVAEFREGRASSVTTSWLLTVGRRRLIDHWRRQKVASANVVELVRDNRSTPDPFAERDSVMSVLGEMPEAERIALVLQHVEGYAVREIAKILDRSEKATESLLSRARASFRSAYPEVDDG